MLIVLFVSSVQIIGRSGQPRNLGINTLVMFPLCVYAN